MKITSVRVRKLVSTRHGYGHHAVELEAEVEPGELFETVAAKLSAEVDCQIRLAEKRSNLRASIDELMEEVSWYERQRDRLKAEVDGYRKAVQEHEKIAELAAKHGLDAEGLANPLPF